MKNIALTLFFNLVILSITFAQNGRYSVALSASEIDCDENIAYFDIQLKAADSESHFRLGDQNYRFSFNPNALVPNSAFIQSASMSGYNVTAGPLGFAIYSDNTLTGSSDTIISYNVELMGGDGVFITDLDWTHIGTIGMNIKEVDACFDLVWHKGAPEQFPNTFVSEMQDNSLRPIEEGDYEDKEGCFTTYCSSGNTLTDIDGAVSNQYNIQLLPTAVENTLTVKYDLENGLTTHINIVDLKGTVIENQRVSLATQDQLTLDVSHLPSGVYILNTMINGNPIPRKFVKL